MLKHTFILAFMFVPSFILLRLNVIRHVSMAYLCHSPSSFIMDN